MLSQWVSAYFSKVPCVYTFRGLSKAENARRSCHIKGLEDFGRGLGQLISLKEMVRARDELRGPDAA